jgi:GMP synthase (glutamine-hydrolysing)
MHESIPVLDFGSQTAQLIVRRLRELGVYSELVPHDAPKEDVLALQPRGIVLSGGPASVYEPGAPQLPLWLRESDLPVLGVCYGMQVQAHALGGRVEGMQSREFGPAEITGGRSRSALRRHPDAPAGVDEPWGITSLRCPPASA